MKQRQNSLEFSLPTLQFILTPLQFQSSHRLEGLYHLQLEKGCQRVNQVKEVIQLQGAREFAFRDQQAFTVRAFKEKNMVFSWSVYKYEDGAMEFVDVLRLDLSQNYSKYINELKNYAFQYGKIMQYKTTNRQYMARGWIGMKSHLKHQQFRQQIKNSTDTLSLLIHIEIKNELDHLTQLQIEKWKASKKLAIKNEKNQDQTQAKSHSSIKLDPDSQELQLRAKPKDSQARKEQQQGIMCLPINQLNIKNWTVLSDIIQASNEQSHFHGDRTDRSDRKPSELGLISEIIPKKEFFKTKTFHFVGENEFESSEFKRNNSLEAIKTGSKVQLENHKEDVNQRQDEFTNSSTIIKPQLQSNINNDTINSSKTRILVLVMFIIFVCLIFPVTNTLEKKLSVNDQLLHNNKKLKKRRFF